MKPKIIYIQSIRRMSECRVKFVHLSSSFTSPAMYRSESAKIVYLLGSMFCVSSHFCNAYTDAVHLPQLTSWLH